MKVNGFQCDACTKIESGNEIKGWLFVRDHETNSGYRERHFCSLHCLGDWVEKQFPVVGEVKSNPLLKGLPEGTMLLNNVSPQKDEYWRDL